MLKPAVEPRGITVCSLTFAVCVQVDYDDANVPSLLSIPLLGYAHYDPAVYAATRQRILSSKNPFFFEGVHFSGIGSPHTPSGMVWPLALSVQGLTASTAVERVEMLRNLLKMQCGNGLMHESGEQAGVSKGIC